MRFFDLAILATALLQREKKLSWRALQREFELDDNCLEDLVFELTEVRRVALNYDDQILLWAADAALLTAAAGRDKTQPPAVLAASAERRQLTVLLCDLVGSTALSMKLDAEDLNEVIRAFQQSCAAVITRFNGYIAKYLGDGMLVCYGYPQAFENAAERAVRSGLDIIEAIRILNLQLEQHKNIELTVRIGIATGPVVVEYNAGESGASKQTFVGGALDMAHTLQHAATPGSVLIADSTRLLIGDAFIRSAAGSYLVKTTGQRIAAWYISGLGAVTAAEESL
jgi:class 3 adenylate cyclase